MAMHIRNFGACVQPTLLQETSTRMGFKRSGNEITSTLDLVLSNALKSGFFVRGDDGRIGISSQEKDNSHSL